MVEDPARLSTDPDMDKHKVVVLHMRKVMSTTLFHSLMPFSDVRVMPLIHAPPHAPPHAPFEVCSCVRRGEKLKIVTPIREPIGRNLSFLVENFGDFGVGSWLDYSAPRLAEFYWGLPERDNALGWFKSNWNVVLGRNIYDCAFGRERGWTAFTDGPRDVLLFKVELPDAVIEQVLAEFLEMPDFKLVAPNRVTVNERYKELKRYFKVSTDYFNYAVRRGYARHFYTEAEIAAMRERWVE